MRHAAKFHKLSGSQFSLIGASSIIALLAIAGCERSLTEPRGAVHTPLSEDQQPFYYYQGERIALVRDPTRLIIEGSSNIGRSAQRSMLASRIVATPEALTGSTTYSVLRLNPGLSETDLTVARRAAFRSGEVKFAAFHYKIASNGADFVLLNRLVVKFNKGVSSAQIDSLNRSLGTTIERVPKPDSGFSEYWLKYPADSLSEPLEVAAKISRSSIVEYSTPDHQLTGKKLYIPTDPFYSLQYYLHNTSTFNGVAVDDNLQPAWDLTLGSASITVSVIDDGVQGTHPELSAAVAGSVGFDALYNDPGVPGTGEWAFSPCTVCLGSDGFADGHGTAIAGEIVASHNGQGIAGIAPNIHLESARVMRNDAFAQHASDVVNAIDWAAEHSDVLNISWKLDQSDDGITGAIRGANYSSRRGGKGSVVVIASGNEGASTLDYPASLSNSSNGIVAVGAIDRFGVHSYSNYGTGLSLVAVSSQNNLNDLTTIDLLGTPGYDHGPTANPNDYTSRFGGTSAAAPQVAGVAALLLSREPSLTAYQVKSRLIQGARAWGSTSIFGAGKLDAYATLIGVSAAITGPTSFSQTCPPFQACQPKTLTWTASISGGNGAAVTYQWKEKKCLESTYSSLGTATAQSITVTAADPSDFYVQLIATSNGKSDTKTIFVDNLGWAPPFARTCTGP